MELAPPIVGGLSLVTLNGQECGSVAKLTPQTDRHQQNEPISDRQSHLSEHLDTALQSSRRNSNTACFVLPEEDSNNNMSRDTSLADRRKLCHVEAAPESNLRLLLTLFQQGLHVNAQFPEDLLLQY